MDWTTLNSRLVESGGDWWRLVETGGVGGLRLLVVVWEDWMEMQYLIQFISVRP